MNTGDGYERGQTPRLGAVICWRKGQAQNGNDGAGHVAIVEEIYDDGSILTSNSAYGGTRFFMKKIRPPYSLGGTYAFQGFIYNPAVPVEEPVTPEPEPEPAPTFKFNIGDKVVINGPLYRSSAATVAAGSIKNKVTNITRRVNAKHPYNTTGDLGWMDESSIQAYSAPAPSTIIKPGDKVKVLKAITYTGKPFKLWYDKYDVIQVTGDRIVIGIKKVVTAAVNKVNLKKV